MEIEELGFTVSGNRMARRLPWRRVSLALKQELSVWRSEVDPTEIG